MKHSKINTSIGLVLLALCTSSACGGEAKRDPRQAPITRTELEQGAAVKRADPAELTYRRYCIGCHGNDGHGNGGSTGADLAALAGPLHTRSDAELIASVRDGKVGKIASMPAHKPILSDAQIAAVVGYVRKQFSPGAAAR
ncbi:MAG: hypothetical protein JWN04_782 [Myxococcaceae bacterium]|nr:hypothetical protein [Myxococcaceae bacterium]